MRPIPSDRLKSTVKEVKRVRLVFSGQKDSYRPLLPYVLFFNTVKGGVSATRQTARTGQGIPVCFRKTGNVYSA